MENNSSVDPNEVAYYERLAHTWWNDKGPFWPLHRLNSLRAGYIQEQLHSHFGHDQGADKPLNGIRMLDIGCGGGLLSEAMARLGARVQGIDVTEKNITVARLHAESRGVDINYRLMTAEDLAEQGIQFDAVLNMEVVEHVADLPGFLRACCRLIRPGGIMFVATINRTFLSWLFAIVGAEYILRWLPKGTHQWRRFPKPKELEALLAEHGLRVTAFRGVRVNPITRRFSLSRYLGVNYMLVAEKAGPARHSR